LFVIIRCVTYAESFPLIYSYGWPHENCKYGLMQQSWSRLKSYTARHLGSGPWPCRKH